MDLVQLVEEHASGVTSIGLARNSADTVMRKLRDPDVETNIVIPMSQPIDTWIGEEAERLTWALRLMRNAVRRARDELTKAGLVDLSMSFDLRSNGEERMVPIDTALHAQMAHTIVTLERLLLTYVSVAIEIKAGLRVLPDTDETTTN